MTSVFQRRLFLGGGASLVALNVGLIPESADACHLTKTCWKLRQNNPPSPPPPPANTPSNTPVDCPPPTGTSSNQAGENTSTPPSSGDASTVGDYGALKAALDSASTGQTIEIADGTYSGANLSVRTSGIRLVARSRLGVQMRCGLNISASNVTVDGLSFYGAEITTTGSNATITRCRSEQANIAINVLGGTGLTVDYCEFINWRYRGICIRPNKGVRNPTIRRSYFTNSAKIEDAGICLGVGRQDNEINLNATVEGNLFENDRSHDENIMVKSSGNTIRNNTLYNSNFIYNRHGKRNLFASNWVENSKGMFINDEGSEVINNMVTGCVQGIQIAAGNIEPAQMKNYDGKYPRAVDILVAGNNANRMAIGYRYNNGFTLPAKDVRIEAHSGRVFYEFAQGTSVGGSASKSAASPSRVSRGEVGVNA